MKNKKIIIIVGLIISLIIIFLIIHPSVLRTPPLSRGGWNTNQIEPKALSEKNIKVFLTVQDKKYEAIIKEGGTVFEAMKKIQDESSSTNPFSFKYKENPGLGSFITEINNVVGSPGKYWIYYVNDKKASVGVSTYVLKEGDLINWNQEGI
jgi:uncharacterized membrane protein